MSAPAGTYNIVADQGATFSRVLVWKDAAGNPVPLAGYTARMQVRTDYFSTGSPVLELSTSNGRIALAALTGEISMSVSATDMTTVLSGEYVYDLELVSGASIVTRLVQGNFTIRPEVTR